MSLRVWLPLTKDLRNQGLDDIEVTSNGATYSASEGKLGGCYTFDGTNDFINLGNISSYFTGSTHPFSICFWIYSSESGTRGVIFSSYGLTSTSNFFSLEINSGSVTNNSLRFDWKASPDWASDVILTPNTWIHAGITYDGTSVKFYKNGELIQTKSQVLSSLSTDNNWYLGRDSRTGTNAFSGKLNDFRIYDHCLSEMEVKQLSQGLILHYPLNRQGFGQENFLKGTGLNVFASGVTDWTTTDRMGSGSGGNGTFSITEDLTCPVGIYSWNVLNNTSGNRDYQQTNQPYITDHIYTASVYAKGTGTLFLRSWDNTDGSQPLSKTFALTSNWKFYSWTFTATAKMETDRCSMHMGLTGAGSVNMCGMKLEEGSIATPWCPNSSDALATTMGLNGTTEYDTSGYCNNGTRTGTFTWTSDTPKYSVSQVFASGNNYIDCGPSQRVLPTDELTVSLWANYSTWGNPISCTEGGGWNFENGSSGIRFPVYISGVGYKLAESNITPSTLANGWHMLTGTFDKTNVKIYIDGVLEATTATGSTNGIGYAANHCYVGAEASGSTYIANAVFVGKLSDVRIYATALSANDVKSLYQNCATIDPDGTIRGQIRS